MIIDDRIREIFANNKIIAIVGAKDKLGSPVEHVGRYFIEHGYEILPVHPARKTAWGIPCVASLAELNKTPDIVCLFRVSEACVEHAHEILAFDWLPKVFWMQKGIYSDVAEKLMTDAGVTVVGDKCMEMEYKRLMINQA